MKPTSQIAFAVTVLGYLALGTRVAWADTQATTAVYRSSDAGVPVTSVGHYRPYRAYYRPYAAYRPYYAYRPYVYPAYVAPAYVAPAYGYGYPVSVRSPYYFGYRYPGARARGYYARPRVYLRYGY